MFTELLEGNNFRTTKTKVGVVLPTWHQKSEYIYECISSVELQSFRDFKLVIVIDGANLETTESMLNASKQLTIPYKIIYREINKGIAFSLNEGFSLLEDCDYFTWISCDNRHYRNFLQVLVSEMDNSSDETVLVYSLFNLIDKAGNVIDGNRGQSLTSFMNRPREQILQNSFIGASFLFKSKAYLSCGKYNEKYETVEDYELWIRLLNLGHIKFIPTALMEYRFGGEFSYTTTIPRERISIKSAEASYENRITRNEIPKVTVIMSAYNHSNHISRSIDSVLNQTYSDFQLIIVDDGSMDNTWAIINKVFDKRITSIRLDANRGKSYAMNLASKFALGKYVLELDSDDWLEPCTLEVMVKQMDSLPENIALCYGNRRIWNDTNGNLAGGPTYYGMSYRDKYEVVEKITTQCPRMYRKLCLDAVGWWPTNDINNERNIVEDLNLTLNLAEKYDFYYINQTLYNQRRHDSNLTKVKIEKCNKQIETLIREKLFQWGDHYTPKFMYSPPWIARVNLIPK